MEPSSPPSRRTAVAGRLRLLAAPRTAALRPVEFTSLLAFSMALAALGIDMMLPAFAAIRRDLGLPSGSTAVAGIVTTYLLGLAIGQVVYGPVSDRFGRRPTLYVGYAVYALGALLATLSPSLTLLLASRFVWGLGAAGPRVVTLAVVRDTFEGERMSRAMSFIMAVFILVPVVAPSLGAAVVGFTSWRWLFAGCMLAVVAMAVWARRLPETLHEQYRLELRFARVMQAGRFVVSNRQTVAYMLAMTSLYAVLASYIASSEIIFGETFGQTRAFPVIFGGLAAVMGAAMLTNARVVGRVGARRLAHGVLIGYVVAASVMVALAVATGGRPPFALFLVVLAITTSAHGLLIPNLNTIAMAPMGSVAGTASSVIGAVQVAGGALLGAIIDRLYDGTVRPLAIGYLGFGLVALGLILWAERGRLFQPLERPAVPVAAES